MIFLDSAVLSEAREAAQMGWVRGVTTNPALLAMSLLAVEETLRELAACIEGEVFYQLTSTSLEGMIAESHAALRILGDLGVLKIPATPLGFQAASRLTSTAVCAVTAVYSPAQAAVAVQTGARYVIPYVNRATRLLGDGLELVRSIAEVIKGSETQILAASIKSSDEAIAAVVAGAHHLTLPLVVLQAMCSHPLTDAAVLEFANYSKGLQGI